MPAACKNNDLLRKKRKKLLNERKMPALLIIMAFVCQKILLKRHDITYNKR